MSQMSKRTTNGCTSFKYDMNLTEAVTLKNELVVALAAYPEDSASIGLRTLLKSLQDSLKV